MPTYHFSLRLVCVALALACSQVQADRGVDTSSGEVPLVPAVFAHAAPVLDGKLDDSLWADASMLDDLHCKALDRAPTEPTTIWLAQDSTHMYFAARMYDDRPDQIRMEVTQRNSNLWPDDFIAVYLDVQDQHRYDGAYVFRVNPRGTQDEYIPDGSAGKTEWVGDWQAVARMDSLGWTVEFAVPFSLFNHKPGRHTVGLWIERHHARIDEWASWPNMGARWDRTKTGDWTGVLWPSQNRKPVFMPYVVGQSSGSDPGGYLGLDMKYTTQGGATFVATANPDFQNVENDILGLDFSYSERQQSDSRPFFTDGRKYLPESWMFYSNRVEQVIAGGKGFGQLGDHRLGLIGAYDRQKVTHTAGLWYWQPVSRLEIENKFAWRHGPEGVEPPDEDDPYATDNLVAVSVIKKSRPSGNGSEYYRVQGGLTHTVEDAGDVRDGYDLEASYERWAGAGELNVWLRGRQISSGFAAINGLLGPEDANQRDVVLGLETWVEHDRKWFRKGGVWSEARNSVRLDNSLYRRYAQVGLWTLVVNGSGFWTEIREENRPPHHDRTLSLGLWWRETHAHTDGGGDLKIGRVGGAGYLLVSARQGIRLGESVSLGVRAQYRRRDLPAGHEDRLEGGIEQQYQTMTTAQYDITPEKAVSGRLIRSHEGWNGYVSYRQIVRRGMDLFVIVGDPSADTWTNRVALKAMVVL